MYELIWLFFIYSFLGWLLECAWAAFRNKSFVNRGVLGGPFCCIYGTSAALCVILLSELSDQILFLFFGSAILYGAVEWSAGKLLERIYHRKWWDYSNHKYHIDGYVSIYSTAIGGLLGVISIKFLNPLLITLIDKIPFAIGRGVILGLLIVFAIDACWTYFYILGLPQRFPSTERIQNRILKISASLNEWIIHFTGRRLEKAFPKTQQEEARKAPKVFAEGCSFYKIFWLFITGAFLGDIVETVFCRITMGIWMSRSSLVWGPFSVVWGLGIAGATWVFYNYRDRSDGFLFWFGTLLGGAFEYICSVFTELVFDQVFWDYSGFAFNLGGRINLLYCFFWGIAAVIWLKKLYPIVSGWIEKIPIKIGKYITVVMIIFICADILVSSAALMRYESRNEQQPASNAIEEWFDIHYNNEKMEKIYPNSSLS